MSSQYCDKLHIAMAKLVHYIASNLKRRAYGRNTKLCCTTTSCNIQQAPQNIAFCQAEEPSSLECKIKIRLHITNPKLVNVLGIHLLTICWTTACNE